MTLERGTLLHKRYRIVEILGQGGMGSIYRAVDENLGVDVAVKENLFTTDEYARQFRLEAVILASLRHPNLPRVSDHFAVGEQGQYLVMDFIEGEDLRQRMERTGTISDDDAVMIGAAMCDALTYMHTRTPSILHRDLKPGNVKITLDGHIFLVDFGLAKLVQGTQATTTGARAMTPGYSPPEQYGSARTDPRTDVYSLGATLYAALCGMIPEDGLARAMDNAQLTPLRKNNPKVSRRLAAAIEKAMAIDPADRFQTAEEFKSALLASRSKTERAPGDFTVIPAPAIPQASRDESGGKNHELTPNAPGISLPSMAADDAKPFIAPSKRRHRISGCLWFLLIVVIVLAGSIILFPKEVYAKLHAVLPIPMPFLVHTPTSTSTSSPTTTSSVTPTTFHTATPVKPPAGFPSTATFAVSPTTMTIPTASLTEILPEPSTPRGGGFGQIAFASTRSGIPQIYLSDIRGQTVTPITNMPKGACQPSWSPDGLQLVFVSPCQNHLDISDSLSKDTALYTINADGSNLVALPTVPGGDLEPAWSPDGKRIAFTSLRDGRPLIYLLNLTDQSVILLTHPSTDFEIARQPSWSPFGNQILFAKKRVGVYQIWAMTDAGQGQQQIALSGQGFWDYLPVWSQDGKTIYFTERKAEGPVQPWAMEIAYERRGTAANNLSGMKPLPVENIHSSPDGLWLVFEGKSANDNRDIFLATAAGDQRTRLTTDPGADFDPAWRPSTPPIP